jgi:hypothetical protein
MIPLWTQGLAIQGGLESISGSLVQWFWVSWNNWQCPLERFIKYSKERSQ